MEQALLRQLCRAVSGQLHRVALLALAVGIVLISAQTVVAADVAASQHYVNQKYGYEIACPATFAAQGEADAGDGQVFLAPKDAGEIRVYAAYNVMNSTLDKRYKESADMVGGKPQYSVRKKDWFAVSGMMDGKIYYEKTLLQKGIFYTVSFTYSPEAKEAFAPVVDAVVKSLKVY